MEWKSKLKRTQSLGSVSSFVGERTWTEAGLRGKITSVSQLVARYQTTVKVSTSIQDTPVNNGEAKPEQVLKEKTLSILESTDTRLESLMRRNDAREHARDQPSLTRSKSMGSLQGGGGSIGALKALFEPTAATQNKPKSSFREVSFSPPNEKADIMPAVNGEVEKIKSSAEEAKIHIPAEAPVKAAKSDAKVTRKAVSLTQMERRKTIGGIDFETIAASQADEKRRSIADFRDSSFNQTKEKLCVSVKAMSALYLSKAVPQESTRSLSKPAQGLASESGRKVKLTKFQPACREMCSACSKTVYPMEKITTDKYIFHRTCFCCKQCKKKLSMHNYAPLYGEFYCIFHYQQLFRRKGNYDEGFGRAQHKNRWLLRNTAGVVSNDTESEA